MSEALSEPGYPTLSTSPWSAFATNWAFFQAELLSVLLGCAYSLSPVPMVELLRQNAWPSPARNHLLLLWAILLGVVSLLVAGATKRFGLAPVGRVARLLLPLIPLAFLPMLLATDQWFHAQLNYLVILGIFGFVTQACVAQALYASRDALAWSGRIAHHLHTRAPWLPLASVVAGAVFYTGYTGYLTVLNHHRWGTGAFDLGIFDNVIYNTIKGYPYRTTIMFPDGAQNFLLSHTPYLMCAFLPIYALFPTPETLLWIQATLIGSGGIVLFFFARTQLAAGYAAALSLLYFLFAPTHGAQFYDFHWLTGASPFLFFLFYAIARNTTWMIGLSAVLVLLLREDLAPGLALLGVILLLGDIRPKVGLFLAVGSGAWFAINKFLIMPSFGTWWFANLYDHLTTPTEKGYGSVIKTFVTNPLFAFPTLLNEGRLIYMLHLLVPLALIPVRSIKLAMILLPGALFTVLTNAGANYSIRYQYSAHYAAYLFAAVVIYLRNVLAQQSSPEKSRIGALSTYAGLALCMVCHSTTYGVVLKPSSFVGGAFPIAFSLTKAEREQLRAFNELEALIPREATVTTTTKDSPHLSNRLNIYAFSHSHHKSEYLFINPTSFGMGSTNQDILQALEGDEYGLVKKVGDMTLWKRGHSSPETKAELARLKRRLGASSRRRR